MALEMKYVDSKQDDPKPYSQRNPRMDEQKAGDHHLNKILHLLTYILGFIEFQIEEVPESQEEGPYTMASIHSNDTHRQPNPVLCLAPSIKHPWIFSQLLYVHAGWGSQPLW